MSPTRYNYFLLLNLEQAVKSITNGRKVIVVNIHEARTPDVAPSELVHPNEALKTRLFFFFSFPGGKGEQLPRQHEERGAATVASGGLRPWPPHFYDLSKS